MNQFWREFIDQYGGEYAAREHFNHLCVELLEYHSPGKQIINANKIDKLDSFHDLLLVYLPKLFTETLNVSRKSQIRKAFNKTIQAVQKHNLKIYKWILCTTHTLDANELKWWNQWKYKNEEQYHIDIDLLDGDKIIELLKRYSLIDKWIKTSHKQEEKTLNQDQETKTTAEQNNNTVTTRTNSEQPQTENPANELKTHDSKDQEETEKPTDSQAIKTENSSDTPKQESNSDSAQKIREQTENTNTQASSSENATNQQVHNEVINEQTQQESKTKPKPKLYIEKKNTYTKVTSQIEKLDEQAKKLFEKLREISPIIVEKFKEEIDLDQALNENIIDLYFKAKNAKVDKQYDKALFYYEILLARQDELEEKLNSKIPEIKRTVKQLEKQITYEQNILLGDIFFAQGNRLKASEFYEDALKDKPESNESEAKVKYNETLGDLMIESGLYNEASKAYDEAIKALKNHQTDHYKQLEKKLQLAKTLNKYTELKYIPIIPDIFLIKAQHIENKYLKNNKLVNKAEYKHIQKLYFWTFIIVGIIFSYFIIKRTLPKNQTNVPVVYKGYPSLTAYSLYNAAMKRGDYFMNKFNKYGYIRVHVLDSAKRAYYRAAFYSQYKKEAVEKYKKAKSIFKSYIADAQRKIKQNPSQYLRIIRQPHEGLQFFEFLLRPSDSRYGKYGYMDSKRNIVIPPIFDYDYHRHTKPGWEDFHKGKAVVCLVISPGDTTYFLINRLGKRVSKIYHINAKK